ncbi:MAG: SufD family Fe-S cluster assembly protein [Gammaproteobacteria bacterium]|nr:SufD family Fe-S cluster assembly protein [Gammaproteobacteria bacterium]
MKSLSLNAYELKENETLLVKDSITIDVKENKNLELSLVLDLRDNPNLVNLVINLGSYSILKLTLFSLGNNGKYNLTTNLEGSSKLDLVCADYSIGNLDTYKTYNLNGEHAEFNLYEYVSSRDSESSNGVTEMVHNAKDSVSYASLFYIAHDNSTIKKDAISRVGRDKTNSTSSENIRGLILGDKAKIDAKPILIIDCDDVHASHGCAIGTLDDNEVYYLMSRGLSRDEAIKIICHSFITPVLNSSKDKEFNDFIRPFLERSVEV